MIEQLLVNVAAGLVVLILPGAALWAWKVYRQFAAIRAQVALAVPALVHLVQRSLDHDDMLRQHAARLAAHELLLDEHAQKFRTMHEE